MAYIIAAVVTPTGDPMNLATSLAREVRRIDPGVVASQIRPMDRYLSDAVAPRRFSLSLMAAFAVAALGANGATTIRDAECAGVSYPTFYDDLARVAQ